MADVAIRVEGLGKKYRLGGERQPYATLGEQVRRWATLRPLWERRPAEQPFWALKDVGFEVKAGEVVGVIGRNGAGKSTLLKILSRITEPTEGAVDIQGRVGSLLEVGTGFHPELTGRENIYLNGAILGMGRREIRSKFDDIVAFAEVEKFIDTTVKYYSSGMYTRLAFAVAAHLEPEILVIDEVLAVGDAEFQKKCLGKMGEVARGGRTVLFVSHNMAAIKQLCTSGILLRSGRLEYAGAIDAVADRYVGGAGRVGQRIIDHTTKRMPAVTVERVTVNGGEEDEVHVTAEDRELVLEMAGQVHESIRGSLQARLCDTHGSLIGIFSPGFERGGADALAPGPFRLCHTLRLPRLNRGLYTLTFELVLPNVHAWFEARDAVRLVHEGTPMATGQVFDSGQLGWLLLDESPQTCG